MTETCTVYCQGSISVQSCFYFTITHYKVTIFWSYLQVIINHPLIVKIFPQIALDMCYLNIFTLHDTSHKVTNDLKLS